MDRFLRYNHSNPKEDTINKFFNRNQSYTKDLSLYDFLMFDGGKGKKNIDQIFDNYSEDKKAEYISIYQVITKSDKKIVENRYPEIKKLPILVNTELFIPTDNLVNELASVKGKNLFLKQKNIVGFWSEKLTQLITDPEYIPLENINPSSDNGYSVEMINENLRVWIWCRALNKIIDVSPFVDQLNINKSDVGSFYFSLNPLSDITDFYNLDNSDILNYFNTRNLDGSYQTDFFHKNFQQNDIAFIRFERLKVEKDQNKPYFDLEVHKQQLPGQVWDMIGLIDSNTIDNNVGSIDYEVNISGRDFTKLLIEDGSYIFHLAYLLGGEEKIIYDGFNKRDKYFKRLFADNNPSYGGLGQYEFISSTRNIADSIGFIVNQISNLGVLGGEDLFSQYKDRRTKAYNISKVSEVDERLSEQLVDGVWQIIKFFVDSQIENRRIIDPSFAQADGTLMDQINKFCQQPFVEFYGDTYGDEFNFIVRQPPFDKKSIIGFLNGAWNTKSNLERNKKILKGEKSPVVDIEEKDISNFSLEWDETYYSAYQISPQEGVFAEYTNMAVGTIIPIIFFSEIAETLGNHRKAVSNIYLDVKFIEGYREALLNDLKYLIDTNIYLPFTRKGSINLVHGDRRIKRGTFIRFKPTGEIYYVDSVSNSINFAGSSIDRETVLQVSRGMIEEYIEGYKGWDENGNIIEDIKTGTEGEDYNITTNNGATTFSYFNIVNTDIIVNNIMSEVDVQEGQEEVENLSYIKLNAATQSYRNLVSKYFPPQEVDNALRIMQAESAGNPKATNLNTTGSAAGSTDSGLFQINNFYHFTVYILGNIFDPEYNIKSAYNIWKQGGWKLWSTSKLPGVIQLNPIKTTKNKENSSVVKVTENIQSNFGLNKQQYDFFLKRKQFNIFKQKR
jgi:hypothetical protein